MASTVSIELRMNMNVPTKLFYDQAETTSFIIHVFFFFFLRTGLRRQCHAPLRMRMAQNSHMSKIDESSS